MSVSELSVAGKPLPGAWLIPGNASKVPEAGAWPLGWGTLGWEQGWGLPKLPELAPWEQAACAQPQRRQTDIFLQAPAQAAPPSSLGTEGHGKGKAPGGEENLPLTQHSLPRPQVGNQVFAEIKSKHNCKCNYREKL